MADEKKGGFLKRLFRFGKAKEEPQALETVEDATSDTAIGTGTEPDPVAHAEAAADVIVDTEAGAAPDDAAGITPIKDTPPPKPEPELATTPDDAGDAGSGDDGFDAEPMRPDGVFGAPGETVATGAPGAVDTPAPLSDTPEPPPPAVDEDHDFPPEPAVPDESGAGDFEPEGEEPAHRAAEPEPVEAIEAAPDAAFDRVSSKDEDEDAARAPEPVSDAARLHEPAPSDRPRSTDERTATDDRAAPEETAAEEAPTEPTTPRRGWFARMREGLSRSSGQLTTGIASVFTKKRLDEDTLQELEDILIQADIGVETATAITDRLADQRMGRDVTDEEVRGLIADEIETVLSPVARELELDLDHEPHVILVVGVNGSGKTTTIGKLGQKLYDAGFSTALVAGDTFRAAAIEQLKIWGERTMSPVYFREHGSDAAALAFDAYEKAKAERRDVMLMDTAGRLQNRAELMAELEKIVRVLKKHDPSAPHTVLLTLDATTGQNALNQVEIFKDIAGVNGLVMTKLDGTARGGILVAIAAKFGLPVYFIGVGEQVADLEPFEARDFARSMVGLGPDGGDG